MAHEQLWMDLADDANRTAATDRSRQIAKVAYRRWLERGRPPGSDLRDWLDAERDFDDGQRRVPASAEATEGQQPAKAGLAQMCRSGDAAGEAELAEFLENAEMPLHWIAADGTILWANRAELEFLGYGREDYVGRHIASFHADRDVIDDILARFSRGESLHNREARLRHKDGSIRNVLISSNVLWKNGAFVHTRCFTADVTDLRRLQDTLQTNERRLAAEHAVGRVLAEGDPLADGGAAVLEALGLQMAWDVGAIWTLETGAAELRCTCSWSRPGAGAQRFETQSRAIAMRRGIGLPGRVWETGKPAWVTDPARDQNFPRWTTAVAQGLHSAVAFPLSHCGRFFGVAEFLSRDSRDPDPGLLDMMWHIGAQIGQAAERRMTERALHRRNGELKAAREIQRMLLPAVPPAPPGYTIAATSHPAQETGGDYYDFLRLPGGSLGLAVGDASGHGVAAALVIAETRAYLKAFAVIESEPGRLLTHANRALAEDLGDGFVTLFLARLDPATRSLTYSSAGHWPGYVFGGDGEVKAKLPSTGLPLGLDPQADYPTPPAIRLDPGDLLLLLTDGVIEAISPAGELFGIDRVLDAARGHAGTTPQNLLVALLARVDEFDGGRVTDDQTVLLLKCWD